LRAKSAVAGKTWPPQRHRFHQVRFCDLRAGVEISQRSRHPLDPVQGAGRKTQLIYHGAMLPSLRQRLAAYQTQPLAGASAASALGVLLLECGKP